MQAGAPATETTPFVDQVISGLGIALQAALKSSDVDSVKATYKRDQQFASKSARLQSEAWTKLRKPLPALLMTRLGKAVDGGDDKVLAQTRLLAAALEVDPKLLEPAWSRAIAPPKPGKIITTSSGPAVVLVQPGGAGRPGVAFMRNEVSRAEYAEFVSRTGRATSKCKNRNAAINFKKRTWDSPGFVQSGSHPAVCVSFEDARAYALWLSQKTGANYRLPTAAEWRQVASYRPSGTPCQDGRISCGQEGTVPVNQGPASPLGLTGVHGNAREWLFDCAGSCREHLVSGLGWRDSATRADPTRTGGMDASVGFDDVGFRLVREIPTH